MSQVITEGASSQNAQNEEVAENAEAVQPVFIATGGMTQNFSEPEPFIENLWAYLYNYVDCIQPPIYAAKPLLYILRDVLAILRSEPTVVDLQGTVTIIGGVHGHGDSLISHLSYYGLPPATTYVFLGNYVGQGFAPHESLFLLLALKVRFPKHVYLLRGCTENIAALKAHDFVYGFRSRGLADSVLVHCYVAKIMKVFPLAVLLNQNYFCVAGGIGEELMKIGINGLRDVRRPARLPAHKAATVECQWACLKLAEDEDTSNDGSPMFTEEMVARFCSDNKICMIIRSRQLVAEGILNLPEQMLTIWSPVSFVDNFGNSSVSLSINGENHKASIMRYRAKEGEPDSLDDYKPVSGRNAMKLK